MTFFLGFEGGGVVNRWSEVCQEGIRDAGALPFSYDPGDWSLKWSSYRRRRAMGVIGTGRWGSPVVLGHLSFHGRPDRFSSDRRSKWGVLQKGNKRQMKRITPEKEGHETELLSLIVC
jgi:hypothetical protein